MKVTHRVHQFCPHCHKASNDSPWGAFCSLACLDDYEEKEANERAGVVEGEERSDKF